MSVLIPTLVVAFAAFCVWLTVRIVNRRDRWAKWTLGAVVGLPVVYVASFGPACWITTQEYGKLQSPRLPMLIYLPLGHLIRSPDSPPHAIDALVSWATLGVPEDRIVIIPTGTDGRCTGLGPD